jgi:hypothetical protein
MNPFTETLEFKLKPSKIFIILMLSIHIVTILAIIFTKISFIIKILLIILNLFIRVYRKHSNNEQLIVKYDEYMEENQVEFSNKKMLITKDSYVSTHLLILRLIDNNSTTFFKKYSYILIFADAIDKKIFRLLKVRIIHGF